MGWSCASVGIYSRGLRCAGLVSVAIGAALAHSAHSRSRPARARRSSARDWQLWLDDARNAAAAGLWREAIHFLYWAAISRLESRRLWPADPVHAPRASIGPCRSRRSAQTWLSQLTSTFERFWYGGRNADEGDYEEPKPSHPR